MAKRMIAVASLENVMKEVTRLRISDKARDRLLDFIEKKGIEIGDRAARFALHAKRTTIKDKDIELAIR